MGKKGRLARRNEKRGGKVEKKKGKGCLDE